VGSILGNRVQRVEDPRMLTVGGTYVEDVPVDAAWVHFVRSEYAHGRILSYDVDDAKKMPGVLGFSRARMSISRRSRTFSRSSSQAANDR
jgi:carbon-monoxide dehydrogenase large subunit